MFNCPLTSQNDYRDKLWLLLPKLVVLDGYDKDGIEVADEEEDDEEEENEEDGSSNGDDDDIGLDYLQKDISVMILFFYYLFNYLCIFKGLVCSFWPFKPTC